MSFIKNKWVVLLLVVAFWLVADQVTKYAVVANLTTPQTVSGQICEDSWQRFISCQHPLRTEPKYILGNALSFVYVENPGAAWGSFSGFSESFRRPFLLGLVLVAVIAMIFYYKTLSDDNWLMRLTMASIIGGAIGNWLDRARLTYVIDFISNDFGFWPFNPWPIYNVADIAVTVSIVVILLDAIVHNPKKAETK